MQQQFSFWSSVQPELLKKVLLEGTAIAGIGVTILVVASVLLPKELLESWGIFLFVLAAVLMTVGLVPYRRLQRLESNPNKIIIESDGTLLYQQGDRILFATKIDQIESLEWKEKKYLYGINVRLKNGKSKLLPFFSKRSFQELVEIVNDEE